MASTIMHLAVGARMQKQFDILDEDRFRLGVILPDTRCRKHDFQYNSHFKTVDEDGKKTYDLNLFYSMFGDKLMVDSLYLGYYMHLVQDLVFREQIYKEYRWNSRVPGNIERLHNDYALSNPYVIGAWNLSSILPVPKDFRQEALDQIFGFEAEQMIEATAQMFLPHGKGEVFFYTEKMADEYIDRAFAVCCHEYEALRTGGSRIRQEEYAWHSQPEPR